MKSKQNIFIISIIGVIILVVGLGFILNRPAGPSKYDDFAKALTNEGAIFYGAFWCSHCQSQKELFGSSKQYLPYVECSNPNNTPTQICVDKKIESFPSWTFKNGINLSSKENPAICEIDSVEGEVEACLSVRSKNGRVWIFPEYNFSIESPIDPVHDGDLWVFENNAMYLVLDYCCYDLSHLIYYFFDKITLNHKKIIMFEFLRGM